MNIDAELAAARARLYAAIDRRCAIEHVKTRQQAEHARRSLGQLFRWRKTKGFK